MSRESGAMLACNIVVWFSVPLVRSNLCRAGGSTLLEIFLSELPEIPLERLSSNNSFPRRCFLNLGLLGDFLSGCNSGCVTLSESRGIGLVTGRFGSVVRTVYFKTNKIERGRAYDHQRPNLSLYPLEHCLVFLAFLGPVQFFLYPFAREYE
jgi:hypothetical protein